MGGRVAAALAAGERRGRGAAARRAQRHVQGRARPPRAAAAAARRRGRVPRQRALQRRAAALHRHRLHPRPRSLDHTTQMMTNSTLNLSLVNKCKYVSSPPNLMFAN